MDANWKFLIELGLPEGAIRSTKGRTIDRPAALRAAIAHLDTRDLDPTDIDVLAAWLSAFKQHWPSTFATVIGDIGEACLRDLLPRVEPNRYLKLRRIAIANLANIL